MNFEAERVRKIKPSATIALSMKAKKLRAEGEAIIDLSVGEPDFDTPANIQRAAEAAIRDGQTRYTAPDGTPALKDAICEKLRRDNGLIFGRSEVSVSNGAKQSIFNALLATLEPGDQVLIPTPYWLSYVDMVLLLGGIPKLLPCAPEEGFKLTPETLKRSLEIKDRWLLLNTPCNPTGATYTEAELAAFESVVRRYPRLLVLSDEIYEHIHFAKEPFCSFAKACPGLRDRTVIINGVSKAYAMTGWRIGYAAGPSELISIMSKIQSQSTGNSCSVSQAASIEALSGSQDSVREATRVYRDRRDIVIDGLSRIKGLEVVPPDGAFYVFPRAVGLIGRRAPTGGLITDDTALTTYFLDYAKVAVMQGSAFGQYGYFRLSFAASSEDLSAAVSKIGDAIEELV